MVNPREVWMAQPYGTLSAHSLGSRLDVQLSDRPGLFSFAVSRPLGDDGVASSVLAKGERPSAMQAMAAAERAAAELSDKLPPRSMPEQQLAPISKGAAHRGLAVRDASGSQGSRAARVGFAPHRRVTRIDELALSPGCGRQRRR